MTKISWASLGAALTMAHLLAWKNWSQLLGPSPQHFVMPVTLPPVAILALGIWMFLLTGLLYGLLESARIEERWRLIVWNVLTIYVLVIMGRVFATRFLPIINHVKINIKIMLLSLSVMALLACIFSLGWKRWFKGTLFILIHLFFLPIVLWGQYFIFRSALSATSEPKPARRASLPQSTWILLFDELDYKLALGESSSYVVSPEFQRFQQESTSLSQATPPSMMTISAIPSLLLGCNFRSADPLDAKTLQLNPASGATPFPWRGTGSFFHDLDHRGRSLAVLGCFLPYDRLLGETSAFVHVEPTAEFQCRLEKHKEFTSSFLIHFTESLPGPSLPLDWNKSAGFHRQIVQNIQTRLKTWIKEPPYDYYWVHLNLPHGPALTPGGNYLDNLAAADRLLGTFRRALESSDLWNSSTIIILGDHWFRNPERADIAYPPTWIAQVANRWDIPDHRTPFMIKLPGQVDPRKFTSPINTAILHNLILTLDNGDIHDADGLIQWLDVHQQDVPIITQF